MIKAMSTKLLSAGILIALLCPAVESTAEISNRVVGWVNNDVITIYELNKRIKERTGKTSDELKELNEESFVELRREYLDEMINEKLAKEKALELGITVSDEEVDSYIENVKRSYNWTQEDLIASLESQGMTLEDMRTQIKDQQEQSSLINYEVKSKAVILEGQLQKYYQDNIDKYKEDERVHVAGIFLLVQDQDNKVELDELVKKGEKILARIRNGEDFGALAKEYSQGPGADEGGELGEFDTAEIDPELKKVIDGLSDGDVSSPITKETGIQIIKLIKRDGGKIKPFEEVRNEIYDTIYNEELSKRYTTWLKDLRDKSYTKINY
jgi:peptidyl-prolyl cis-trans isomerase SurA